MKIQIALSASGGWNYPKAADLTLEYKYEYDLPQRNWPQRCKDIGAKYPLFDNVKEFIQKVKASPLIDLTDDMYVNNLTHCKSIQAIEMMVAIYAFPRDVKRIVAGFREGVTMPAPIVIKGNKGMWILSGNTRQNVAQVLGIPRKIILVDAT